MRASEQWLDREDAKCRAGRLTRLDFVASLMPEGDYMCFPGGEIARHLFEEARYCFVYGQFLASILLGMAFIEQTLAAEFYAAGRNDLERAPFAVLLEEALASGWLSDEEYVHLSDIRKLRNPITHFRAPFSRDTVEFRSVQMNQFTYGVLEMDARFVMRTMFQFLSRHSY